MRRGAVSAPSVPARGRERPGPRLGSGSSGDHGSGSPPAPAQGARSQARQAGYSSETGCGFERATSSIIPKGEGVAGSGRRGRAVTAADWGGAGAFRSPRTGEGRSPSPHGSPDAGSPRRRITSGRGAPSGTRSHCPGSSARSVTTAPFGHMRRQPTSITATARRRGLTLRPAAASRLRRSALASRSSRSGPKPPSSFFEHLRQTSTMSRHVVATSLHAASFVTRSSVPASHPAEIGHGSCPG